jgi:hypothetical protein
MGEVIPMEHVCRDCLPRSKCSECQWTTHLLEQETRGIIRADIDLRLSDLYKDDYWPED